MKSKRTKAGKNRSVQLNLHQSRNGFCCLVNAMTKRPEYLETPYFISNHILCLAPRNEKQNYSNESKIPAAQVDFSSRSQLCWANAV